MGIVVQLTACPACGLRFWGAADRWHKARTASWVRDAVREVVLSSRTVEQAAARLDDLGLNIRPAIIPMESHGVTFCSKLCVPPVWRKAKEG